MGFQFEVDRSNCLNCGICMDVCPVQALDMTRTLSPTIESGVDAGDGPKPWMMEFPIQSGTCIGCQLCATECPTAVITVSAVEGTPAVAAQQGPISHGPESDSGWVPLSAYTTESLKETHTDPWGDLTRWQPGRRQESWQVWRTWNGGDGSDRLFAPCQEACPVGTDAGRYVALVGEGRYADALAVAAEYNPFPSVCGRVCTAPCETECRRGVMDEPVAIRELKRYAADHGMEGYPKALPPEKRRKEGVAIVGAGPTGLSAAYQLVRGGYNVTVIEAMPVAGGMMAIGIPEYRLSKQVLQAEINRVLDLGVELKLNTALGRDITLNDLKAQGYDAILLATGAMKSQPLGVPGEDLHGVWPATLFLKRVNLGENVTLSGPALVVGGGSTAMDAARSAWRAGASSVQVLYRRTKQDMPAQHEEIRAAEHEGVSIEPLVSPVEIVGRRGAMTEVRCQRLQIVGRTEDGRNKVAPVPGSTFTISARTLLVAVGEAPDPSILPEGSSIQFGDWGGLLTDPETLMTAQPGVFAAGDVATGPKSVIEGVAQGQRAAWAIDRHLRRLPESKYVPLWRRASPPMPLGMQIDLERRERASAELATIDSRNRQAEVSLGLSEDVARAEAQRCLRCDVVTSCQIVQVKRKVLA
ncbi:MAG TPA: FAD-dependent oxidoreductase [Candidatus Dormibacteraeota bacterium]|nr:FAD-dependent oxidoreductase [Candidatus Dormibacteraeota bacterium]